MEWAQKHKHKNTCECEFVYCRFFLSVNTLSCPTVFQFSKTAREKQHHAQVQIKATARRHAKISVAGLHSTQYEHEEY